MAADESGKGGAALSGFALSRSDYRRFGERLREARRGAGLTQEQAAARLGSPQSYVSKCESGERRVDVLELAQFSVIYGKPPGWFMKR